MISRTMGATPFRNSTELLKNPAASKVTVTVSSVSLSQYQPWIPGNGAT